MPWVCPECGRVFGKEGACAGTVAEPHQQRTLKLSDRKDLAEALTINEPLPDLRN